MNQPFEILIVLQFVFASFVAHGVVVVVLTFARSD